MAFHGWPVEAIEFYEGLEVDNSKAHWTVCIAWKSWEVGAWLGTPEPLERARDFLRTAEALVTWLDTHVGPSELEGAWG